MKQYNRALDYTVLALSELTKGNGVLAAKLMASAVAQPDITQAINILEASNKQAFALQAKVAKQRLTAADEFPFADEVDGGAEDEMEGDPLDEIEDEEVEAEFEEDELDVEEAPAMAMAKVLSSMVRRPSKK
jgi:hypothetical protein